MCRGVSSWDFVLWACVADISCRGKVCVRLQSCPPSCARVFFLFFCVVNMIVTIPPPYAVFVISLLFPPPCRRLPRDSSEIESNEGTQASSWVLFVVAHVLLPALMLADLLAHRGTLREHYDLTRRAPHHPHDRPLKVGSPPAAWGVTPSTLSLPFYFVPWKIFSLFFFFFD